MAPLAGTRTVVPLPGRGPLFRLRDFHPHGRDDLRPMWWGMQTDRLAVGQPEYPKGAETPEEASGKCEGRLRKFVFSRIKDNDARSELYRGVVVAGYSLEECQETKGKAV